MNALVSVAIAAAMLAATPSAQVGAATSRGVVRIGAKNFTESAVLAELMAQVVEAHTELVVERRTNLGGTMVCWTALTAGEIDVYAEYTGTCWATILRETARVTDPLRVWFDVERRCRVEHDVRWIGPFGFENSYALAMREHDARTLGIARISDLAAHHERLRAGFGLEFGSRNDGYPGLVAAYGLDLDVRTLEHGLAYEAMQSGAIDVMDAYTTDGKLLRFGLRVLEDDRRCFPPYHAAPIVHGAALRTWPELEAALSRLTFRVDARDASLLNLVVEEGATPAAAARAWLEANGLVDGVDPAAAAARAALGAFDVTSSGPTRAEAAAPGMFAAAAARAHELPLWLLQHLWLTLVSVALAALAALPLGIAAVSRERLRRVALGFAGVVQTIPSLAMLALMIPLLGLGVRSAVAAMFLYALLPILRNTCAGIAGVAPELVDAARGMGMTPAQVLRLVQLPLAMPTIMAGLRTSTVIGVGVATLAAFLGSGGLGEPILTGLYLNDAGLILLGAVPAALLAVIVDAALGVVERRLDPGRRRAATR